MLPLLKSYCKLSKAAFVVIVAAYVAMPHIALAFDSQSVLKMHIKISTMQSDVKQIATQDVEVLNRIQALELELNTLRNRLMQYENKLTHDFSQQQLADGQVLQRPLEDPYSAASPLVSGPPAAKPLPMAQQEQKMAQAVPLLDGQEELNTVPEALRSQPPLEKPEPQAYAATALPEAALDELNASASIAGRLGSQAPDVMAFNEAKGYYDDAYYVLSERKFNQFIQYYRQSTLISNAYFWLGESYYKRKNYNAAARVFYQGYRSNKKGAKAPDNLYKLAASLLLLGNKSDACAAYYEVDRRYSESHPQLSSMAQAKQKEHACL
ncbi:MAG: hypothetical protein COB24_07270 [Hyphomicrobiales bacterium]|nr:MAG: hypothetical protein COB24_07270 [Hyphomicrobiales bacterium]